MSDLFKILDNIVLLIYLILVMIILSNFDYKKMGKKVIPFAVALASILGMLLLVSLHFGTTSYLRIFPLIVPLPLFIVFSILSEYKGFKLLFILLTTLIWTTPLLLIANVLSFGFEFNIVLKTVIHLILLPVFLVVIRQYFKTTYKYMLTSIDSGWPLFCAVPALCLLATYVGGWVSGGYSSDVWAQTNIWRFSLASISFASYILIMANFNLTKKHLDVKSHYDLLDTQLYGAIQYINSLKSSQEQIRIYHHDLRHHLQLINTFAQSGNNSAISEYIHSIQDNVNHSASRTFCENNTINMILSAFYAKAEMQHIDLMISGSLPEDISIPESDFCVLLSNALENAINAANLVIDRERMIKLSFHMKNDRLLLDIRNPYCGEIQFDNERPIATEDGHGFGTRSIALIVEKHNGLYHFETIDNDFVLSIVL